MATYNGLIISGTNKLTATRISIKNGEKFETPFQMGGVRCSVKKGLDLKNYHYIKFERIPKERVLNQFKRRGVNIQY